VNTRSVNPWSRASEEDGGGRKRRRNVAAEEENPRPCRQYRAPRADSLHTDEEDDEAHPPVVSARRGVA
jgi:hypothetical protein